MRIKACALEFRPEKLTALRKSLDRRWVEKLENLQLVLGFERRIDPEEKKKKESSTSHGMRTIFEEKFLNFHSSSRHTCDNQSLAIFRGNI